MDFIICCNISFIFMLFVLSYFLYALPSFYKVLSLKGNDLEKKKLNNRFQKFISIRGIQIFDDDYTFLIHYKLCIWFLISVILNLISGIIFLILNFYFNIILLILTIILSVFVCCSYLIISLYIYIKKRYLIK